VDWVHLAHDRVLSAGSSERSKEPSGSLKIKEFLDYRSSSQFLKKDSAI
jgi:hypothetical protein